MTLAGFFPVYGMRGEGNFSGRHNFIYTIQSYGINIGQCVTEWQPVLANKYKTFSLPSLETHPQHKSINSNKWLKQVNTKKLGEYDEELRSHFLSFTSYI